MATEPQAPRRDDNGDQVSPRSVLLLNNNGHTTAPTDAANNDSTEPSPSPAATCGEPSPSPSPRSDEAPPQWKGAMDAWRSKTKRRLLAPTMSSLRTLSIRSGAGAGTGKWRWPTTATGLHRSLAEHELCALRLSFRTFTLSELKKATANFSKENVVGKGGHAMVYRGRLPDGTLVAVKRLSQSSSSTSLTAPERMESFLSELGHAVNVRHANVARLVGVGVDGGEHLVFPFSRLGCLSRRLHEGGAEGAMPWDARFRVALGAAAGLEYLHERCARRIVHRDVKPANILLKDDYEPLICDFGLAKWMPAKTTHYQVTTFEGTFGYVPPEYTTHGIYNEKTDVFAFGVVLLELLTGRRAVDGRNLSLVTWARPFLGSKDEVFKMVDPALGGRYDMDQLGRVRDAAKLCIHSSPALRPQMSQVARMLRGEEEETAAHRRASSDQSLEAHETDVYDETLTPRRSQDDLSRHQALAFDF